MQKLTTEDKVTISNLMFAITASYIKCFCVDRKNTDNTNMYTDDVIHNITALKAFNKNSNVQELHNSIMQQDTLVREYFIKVLHYIERNDLIEGHRKRCI